MGTDFERSLCLNTIPKRKLIDSINEITDACNHCSQIRKKAISDSIDGLCSSCSLRVQELNRYYYANIPVEYWSLRMEKNFTGDPRLLKRYNDCANNLSWMYKNGVSICFAGNHGLGKTFVVTSILKEACLKGYFCLYSTLSDIVAALLGADNQEKFIARNELINVDFLVIDEFDSRFMASENASDLFGRTLENVFRTRSQNKMPTLICTNSPNIIESFQGPIRQSLESLIKGYVKTFPVLGEDHRKKIVKT